jgi:predicted AAA+ superfamily ATPase
VWIERSYELILRQPPPTLQLFPVWLFLGPRQVGKSSLLQRSAGPDRRVVNLDDLAVRARAIQDPVLFAADFKPPLLLDEIQYAPALLSVIKRFADAPGVAPGAVWLTGSQSFEVMQGVQESLAGRVAVLNLFGLSDEEKRLRELTPESYFAALWATTFPKLAGLTDPAALDLYLSSYLQTYIAYSSANRTLIPILFGQCSDGIRTAFR